MQKRVLLIAVVIVLGGLFLLGLLVDRIFFYIAFLLGMILMHLFGHGHGQQYEEAKEPGR